MTADYSAVVQQYRAEFEEKCWTLDIFTCDPRCEHSHYRALCALPERDVDSASIMLEGDHDGDVPSRSSTRGKGKRKDNVTERRSVTERPSSSSGNKTKRPAAGADGGDVPEEGACDTSTEGETDERCLQW